MTVPDIPAVSVSEAHDRPPGAALLDVREDDEWLEGHAPGAIHLPLGRLALEELPPGRPLYCICRSGNRSGRAVEALTAAGVDARNVSGGMQAWVAAGLPVA